MDISAITALNSVNGTATVSPTSLTGMLAEKEKKAEGTMFETFLNPAIRQHRHRGDTIHKSGYIIIYQPF